MSFIGRTNELTELNELYLSKQSKLIVIYGRRRVGKSRLVEQFIKSKPALCFEGLEGLHTQEQINLFLADLSKQLNDPILAKSKLDNWTLIFDYLTKYFSRKKKKLVLFLDEFQWLAAGQNKLISLLKKYWDKEWSKQNVMLILCGSVSSYMVKKVIQSKALYGRINWQLCLHPLNLSEIHQLLGNKRSKDEVLKYAMIFGGIPKYLNEINTHLSFEKNINKLCFTRNGILIDEYKKAFYSQFKEYGNYITIVEFLKTQPHTLKDVANKLKLPSGGGVKSYLDNLESALFVTSYTPYNKKDKSRLKKYKLTDEYLRFYFKYISPNLQIIKDNVSNNIFTQKIKPAWDSWMGFAFENLCLKNAMYLAEKMGFADEVISYGPLFHRGSTNFQIDLLYLRSDNVITLCEMKYTNQPISTKVIPEVERKAKLIEAPARISIEKALITRMGVEQSLIDSDYFNYILTVDDLL